MRQSIQMAVAVIRSNPKSSDSDILRLLVASGADRPLAIQLVTLVPLAYGRVGLEGCGVSFSDNYIRMERGGPGRERTLNSLPLWKEAIAFARHEVANGADGDALLAVAGRSPEIEAINKALHDGRKLQNLVISPPVFMWPEFASSVIWTRPTCYEFF